MTLYMVQRKLGARTTEQMAAFHQAAHQVAQQFNAAGKSVHYLCTTLLPDGIHSICWFEASDAALVRELNERADLPFTQITEPPVELLPQGR